MTVALRVWIQGAARLLEAERGAHVSVSQVPLTEKLLEFHPLYFDMS